MTTREAKAPYQIDIWDALIVLAVTVLLRQLVGLGAGPAIPGLAGAPVLLLQHTGALAGLALAHLFLEHRAAGSRVRVVFCREKPLWYLGIGALGGVLGFAVLTLGYGALAGRLGSVHPVIPYAGAAAAAQTLPERIVLLAGLVVPAVLVQETVFRGYLYQTAEMYWGSMPALLFSALVFAFSFLDLWLFVPLFLLGILLVLLREMTGSLLTPMVAAGVWQLLALLWAWFL